MNRLLDFTGGKPNFNIDDMLWNDEATYNALNDVFRAFGDNYIIQGCTGTTSITAGYVMLDGEMLKVDAHTKTSTHFEKVTTYDAGGDVTFNDGTPRQTWQINRATITAGSGNLEYLDTNRFKEVLSVALNGTRIFYKILEIGDWNMDSSNFATVTHGITNWKNIRSIDIIVRNDDDDGYYKLERPNIGAMDGGVSGITSTVISLSKSSTFFSGTDFDSTSYNRGWVTVGYVE